MKKFLIIILIAWSAVAGAQTDPKKIYDPNANAEMDLKTAVEKAKKENKQVLIQAGGNWCSWCIEFARFAKADPHVDSIINKSYVWYHLNWSKENKNVSIFEKYGFPQRFGFPVFIILNDKGERIHTQNSEYLEDGKRSYDPKKVLSFLSMWTPDAVSGKVD